MTFSPDMLKLYAITDRRGEAPDAFLKKAEEALRGGVTCLQLREKGLSLAEYTALAKEVAALCRRYGVPLIINDNYKAALASGAAGVHVGAEDTPIEEIRRLAGPDFIIGATAKTPAQARAAAAAGADYMGVGAVFASPTKQNAIRITGDELRAICEAAPLPAVAIGGITEANAPSLKGTGIRGIAVVSAIFSAADPAAAAARLLKISEDLINS